MIFVQIHDSRRLLITYSFTDVVIGYLKNGKTGNKKRAICFTTWLQNELNSDVARFTTYENKPYNLISCKTGSNMGVKTRNIATQLGLQQCCKTSCTFLVTRFTTALVFFFLSFLWCSDFCFHPELCRFWTTVSRYHHSFGPGMEFFVTEPH